MGGSRAKGTKGLSRESMQGLRGSVVDWIRSHLLSDPGQKIESYFLRFWRRGARKVCRYRLVISEMQRSGHIRHINAAGYRLAIFCRV